MTIPPARAAQTAGDGVNYGARAPATVAAASPHLSAGPGGLSLTPRGLLRGGDDPSSSLATITASDVTVYDPPLRAIYVGAAGNVAVLAQDDSVAVTFVACPIGTILPVIASKVMATNTTATALVGLR